MELCILCGKNERYRHRRICNKCTNSEAREKRKRKLYPEFDVPRRDIIVGTDFKYRVRPKTIGDGRGPDRVHYHKDFGTISYVEGKWMTYDQLSILPGCKITRHAVRERIKRGNLSIFAPKFYWSDERLKEFADSKEAMRFTPQEKASIKFFNKFLQLKWPEVTPKLNPEFSL